MTLKTKIYVLESCVFSHLLYAMKTWTIEIRDSKKLPLFDISKMSVGRIKSATRLFPKRYKDTEH